jgi:hypothetical protein
MADDNPKDERSFFEKAVDIVNSAVDAVSQMRRKPKDGKKKRPPLASNREGDAPYVGSGGANRRDRVDEMVDKATRGE